MNHFLETLKSRFAFLAKAGSGNNEWLNERIDYFLDSFYKLDSDQRTLTIAGIFATFIITFVGIFWIYHSASSHLEDRLSKSFDAMYRLQSLKDQYEAEVGRLDAVVESVRSKTSGLRLRPFFEAKSNEMSADLRKLAEKSVTIELDNPLSEKVSRKEVEFEFNKISLPKLLNFLIAIERSNKFLTVSELKIRGRFKDKLYFDILTKIRGYVVE